MKKTLLNPAEFEIDMDLEDLEDGEKALAACKRLIESWSVELETEMLQAFITLYYDEMYQQWGPDEGEEDEESEKYWQEIQSPQDLVDIVGTDVFMYALEDGVYAKSKSNPSKYESQNVEICVILSLNCPWDEDHGWAAAFADGRLLKVARDVVDVVYLD
ncbi:MAG: hypothetical protein FWG66_13815 [Spirochaetes bacterium]|nr:hypothetical protein [Spirochaetota bacterium]